MSFKAQKTGMEDKVLDFGKHKYVSDFAKNCKAISKYIALNYNYGGPKMAMATKKMEKPTIDVPEVP